MAPWLAVVVGYFTIGGALAVGLVIRTALLDSRRHPTGTPKDETAAADLIDHLSAQTDRPLLLIFVITAVAWPYVLFGVGE